MLCVCFESADGPCLVEQEPHAWYAKDEYETLMEEEREEEEEKRRDEMVQLVSPPETSGQVLLQTIDGHVAREELAPAREALKALERLVAAQSLHVSGDLCAKHLEASRAVRALEQQYERAYADRLALIESAEASIEAATDARASIAVEARVASDLALAQQELQGIVLL